MGCSSSKTLAKSASTREEFHTPLKKETLVSKNGTDHKFITLLCTSKQLNDVEEPEDCEKKIEIINAWELLAGLEDEEEVEEERETESLKCLNTEEGEGEKGLRRKLMATELAALKVPALEVCRTGSLRDWLMMGGQVMCNGSNAAPKFGDCERWEESVIDPDLVAQFEQAMEDLTVEEEEILSQIVKEWEGNLWF